MKSVNKKTIQKIELECLVFASLYHCTEYNIILSMHVCTQLTGPLMADAIS